MRCVVATAALGFVLNKLSTGLRRQRLRGLQLVSRQQQRRHGNKQTRCCRSPLPTTARAFQASISAVEIFELSSVIHAGLDFNSPAAQRAK